MNEWISLRNLVKRVGYRDLDCLWSDPTSSTGFMILSLIKVTPCVDPVDDEFLI